MFIVKNQKSSPPNRTYSPMSLAPSETEKTPIMVP